MIKSDLSLLETILSGNKKEICCVYGEPATGKTTLVKEAAISQSEENKKVVFIDSEKSFNVERMIQLADNRKEILDNIFVLKPNSLKEQGSFLENLLKLKNLGLVIIDTIGIFYRIELGKDPYSANKEMDRQLNLLSDLCLSNVSVLITNQVYMNIDTGKVSLVGGNMLRNWSKSLIRLEKKPRKLILEKPNNKEILFRICDLGLGNYETTS